MAQQVASQFSPTDEWLGAVAILSQSLWLQLGHFLRPPQHALSTHFSKARPVVPQLSADEDAGGSGSLDQTLDEVEVALSAHPSWQAPQEGAEEGAAEFDRVVQEVTQRIGRTDPPMATTHFSKARPGIPRLSADADSGSSGSLDETLDEVEVDFSPHPSWQPPQEGAEEGAQKLHRVVQVGIQRIGRKDPPMATTHFSKARPVRRRFGQLWITGRNIGRSRSGFLGPSFFASASRGS